VRALVLAPCRYDGKKVDVWAAGVLLFVMLLGKFPFEAVEETENSSTAGMYDIWLQQIKSNWRDHPGVS
jgi:serine/threonine-protein kinase SRK2